MLQVENTLFTIVMLAYFAAMILYFSFIAVKRDGVAKVAIGLHAAGLALHTAALVCRGIGAGRLPLTNQYEFATSFAWGLSLVSLVFVIRYKFPVLGAFAAPVTFLVIGYAAMQSREVRELMPSLRSNWLGFHVSTAIIAYGAFGVSCVLSVIFLLRERMKASGFMDQHIPDREKLDMISYRSVSLGLLFLTFTIVTGVVAGHVDHIRRLPAPAAAPGLAGPLRRDLRGGRLRVRDIHLHRREHAAAWRAQLRLRRTIWTET